MDEYLLQELAYSRGYEAGQKALKESGTVFCLPCRVGDKIYVLRAIKPHKKRCAVVYTVVHFCIDDRGVTLTAKSEHSATLKRFMADDIGVTVFLTMEQAEGVLANDVDLE